MENRIRKDMKIMNDKIDSLSSNLGFLKGKFDSQDENINLMKS